MRKINKREARKLYNNYKTITLYPNKVRPGNMWIAGLPIRKTMHDDFDGMVDMFALYNCNHNDTGKRVAYYVEERDLTGE